MSEARAPYLVAGLALAIFLVLPWAVSGYWVRVLTSIFMYAALAQSINFMAGFTGYADFGNVVFFNNLKHCGIVDTPETFYHAAVSVGTHQSRFSPVWRRRICGVRAMPRIEPPAVAKE